MAMLREVAREFEKTMNAAFPNVLPAFDRLRRGYGDDLPLAPPRSKPWRGSDDDLWHAKNESKPGHRKTLGDAVENLGLPFYEKH